MVTMPDQQNDPALERSRLAARAEAHAGLIAEHLAANLDLPRGVTLEFDTRPAPTLIDAPWPNELPPEDVFDRYARGPAGHTCRTCGSLVDPFATATHDQRHASSHVDTVARTLALAAYARGAGVCSSCSLHLATEVDTRGPASSDRLIAWMREAERQALECAEYEHDART
jgi:hypothetical protein